MRVTDFFNGGDKKGDELVEWFGKRVTVEMEAF
jgi:ribonuclease H2 subunit A